MLILLKTDYMINNKVAEKLPYLLNRGDYDSIYEILTP